MIATDGRPTISSPGSRIPASEVDFRIRGEGSLILLWAVSDDGVGWAEEHLPDDATRWAGAYVVERRYFENIADALDHEGLIVGRSG